jgi:hypothetical protein
MSIEYRLRLVDHPDKYVSDKDATGALHDDEYWNQVKMNLRSRAFSNRALARVWTHLPAFRGNLSRCASGTARWKDATWHRYCVELPDGSVHSVREAALEPITGTSYDDIDAAVEFVEWLLSCLYNPPTRHKEAIIGAIADSFAVRRSPRDALSRVERQFGVDWDFHSVDKATVKYATVRDKYIETMEKL